ncbi:MAG: radical SAM protein [Candidatus Nanohaloarchaeota archaeon QJJ-7]|nr:radical SAM protein [Candidatus Nanohaloarchaeota archaeon QJJ-7]
MKNSLLASKDIMASWFRGESRPVAVRWNLTYRCNFDCRYCNLPEKADRDEELSTDKVLERLEEMGGEGVRRISFSGGEPLLREDIGEILDKAQEEGITATMNTNGTLIPHRIDDIRNADLLKVSIDGPEEVHSRYRQDFEKVMDGVETAREEGIPVTLATTFTEANVDHLEEMVEIAQEHGTMIAIQRASDLYENFGEAQEILPSQEKADEGMEKVMELKRENPGVIRNSMRHLRLIKDYPDHEQVSCTAGKLFYMVMPDGALRPCDRIPAQQELPNIEDKSFGEAYRELDRVECYGCPFCGSMELNYLYNLEVDVISDLLKFLRTGGNRVET